MTAVLLDHLEKQQAKLRNVPLAIAQLIEVLPDRLVAIDFERLKEGPAGVLNAKTSVQHQQRIGNGIDDALRLDVAGPQKAVKVFRIHDERPSMKA